MPNLGWQEILLVLVVVLLLFGAKRLPEIGAAMGKGIRDFKRSLSDTERAFKESGAAPDKLPRAEQEQTIVRREEEPRAEPKRLL